MSRCWGCPNVPQTSHFDVNLEWEKAKQTTADCQHPEEQFVNTFLFRTKDAIASYELDNLQICKRIYARVHRTRVCPEKCKRNKSILFGVVDIMAYNGIENRNFFRQVLTLLFEFSGYIDREVFLFEFAGDVYSTGLTQDEKDMVKKKQIYVLENIAGWKLPSEAPWTECPTVKYYIELPFRRPQRDANSHLMAEALYRQNDPELVLMLLRHGIEPSCVYLWPVCILVDMKQTRSGVNFTLESSEQLFEEQVVRYFCRARHYIQVRPVSAEDRHASIASLSTDISYDSVLIVPPRTEYLVPNDRHLIPSKLMHQCRLNIRKSLLEADCLPSGIKTLPLPAYIKNYIDLAYD